MFEVREIEWDVSFLRNYLNKDLVMREDMYLFQRQGKEYKVIDKEWEMYASARKYAYKWWLPILSSRRRRLLKNGELYIKHSYEGIELDLKYLEKVLPYLHQLWGRTVHMESIVESKGVVFSYDGKMVHRKYV